MGNKILIVDDDRNMNDLLKILLELDGFSITTVLDGTVVLQRAAQVRPDVILMDVHIGGQHGLDILRDLRQHAELAATPVIMSSGMALEDECLQAGANEFILKPYPPEQLTALLKKVTT